jgi:hypothetical protein
MKKEKLNCLLEQVRKKGRNGDTILAHINPLEAAMLKKAGGSGTINPKTGLPEFGIFSNPKKWLKSNLGGGAGAFIGNMILPGIGGVLGGAAGGALGSKIRGRNDAGQAALRGAGMGAALPTAAGLLGTGANALGATNAGHALTKYGNINALLPSLGLGNVFGSEGANSLAGGAGANALLSQMHGADKNGSALENFERSQSGVSAGDDESFMGKLKKNSKNYLAKPKNLLSLGSLAMQYAGKEKKVTAAQKGRDAKAEMLAARLTPAEMAEQEQYDLAMEQARRRVARNKFLPEERININPLYNKVSSPQEYNQSKRWLSYYDNPQFTGQPIRF